MKPSKIALFIISLFPLAWLVYLGIAGKLGANPVEYVVRDLGDWGLRFLLITLAITPLRILTKNNGFARYRRTLGLFAFFYISLHFLTFFIVDMSLSFSSLCTEILKRKFITVGIFSFLILVPLAVTSADIMIKKMGGAAWRKLHKLVYPAALLAVLHFYWMAKADKTEPLIYAGILAALLLFRIYKRFSKVSHA